MIDGWGIFYEIILKWISLDLTDDKSTMVQVMACGAVRQQVITWITVDPDLCLHMASLGHIELNEILGLILCCATGS